MEIVALESMIDELEQARRAKKPVFPTATPGPSRSPPPTRTPATEAFRAATGQTPRMPTTSQTSASLRRSLNQITPRARTPVGETNRVRSSLTTSTSSPQPSTLRTPVNAAEIPLRSSVRSPLHASQPSPLRHMHSPKPRLAQSIATSSPGRSQTRATPAQDHASLPARPPGGSPGLLAPPGTIPEGSTELDAIAGKIWDKFGENLRYVCPGCTSASFTDTFRALAALESGGGDAPPVTGHGENPGSPLSIGVVFMAHVLLLLMRSASPHTLALADIKRVSETWWTKHGRNVFMENAGRQPPNDVIKHAGYDTIGHDHSGSQLVTTAVYSLVAKKLLRINRAGGAPSVRFS